MCVVKLWYMTFMISGYGFVVDPFIAPTQCDMCVVDPFIAPTQCENVALRMKVDVRVDSICNIDFTTSHGIYV